MSELLDPDLAELQSAKGCPVMHEEFFASRPLGAHWALGDRLREQGVVHWNTHAQGYWIFTSHEAVRDIYRAPEVFSSQSITPWDPFPAYKTIPTMVDAPDHLKYRRLLNPWFTADQVRRSEDDIRAIAARRIAEIAPRGRCNFPREFALDFPTEVFLSFTGLPLSDTADLCLWTEDFQDGYGGDPDLQQGMADAIAAMTQYCRDAVSERRAEAEVRPGDYTSYLMHASFGGERSLTEQEVVDLLLLSILGGLDTTRGQLSFLFKHLAENPGDRIRLLEDPDVIPRAVEEALRFYTILFGDGRKVTRDVAFHGVELKAGDMVWALVGSANRDPHAYERANEFVVDRQRNLHASFAMGPHRCLGIHLARADMRIATEEWLRAIPEFRLAAEGRLMERGAGSMLSPRDVPLVWT